MLRVHVVILTVVYTGEKVAMKLRCSHAAAEVASSAVTQASHGAVVACIYRRADDLTSSVFGVAESECMDGHFNLPPYPYRILVSAMLYMLVTYQPKA